VAWALWAQFTSKKNEFQENMGSLGQGQALEPRDGDPSQVLPPGACQSKNVLLSLAPGTEEGLLSSLLRKSETGHL
jgi:hypothetical protein